ncbi:hypothetical protein E2562_027735 [Oryza meyeriana var. granulata]|uniref:Uncharacterized protein n=1 Tax=Oryza meyeriana var. granulata TaxID=110450 RepID=A0A6G1EQI1_9ORYZ|nr:hypothetical protein E2562_027735 [Oryza meyeriana var. granulata]
MADALYACLTVLGSSSIYTHKKAAMIDSCKMPVSHRGGDYSLAASTMVGTTRKSSMLNKAMDEWLLDHLSDAYVLAEENLMKYTRGGEGLSHLNTVRMMKSRVLSWGTTHRRNVAYDYEEAQARVVNVQLLGGCTTAAHQPEDGMVRGSRVLERAERRHGGELILGKTQ